MLAHCSSKIRMFLVENRYPQQNNAIWRLMKKQPSTWEHGNQEFSWFAWNLGTHCNNCFFMFKQNKVNDISCVWCWICQNYLHTLVTLFEINFMWQVTLATCKLPTVFKKIHHLIDMCHLCILLMRIYPSYMFSGCLLSR